MNSLPLYQVVVTCLVAGALGPIAVTNRIPLDVQSFSLADGRCMWVDGGSEPDIGLPELWDESASEASNDSVNRHRV